MVNRWKDLLVRRRIASKLVGHELPRWFILMLQGLAKEPFGGSAIPLPDQQNIGHVPILIHRSPEVAELAADLDADLIHMQDVVQLVLPATQVPSKGGTEFATPQSDRLAGDCDATPGEKVFDISEAKGEPMMEPHRVTDDLRREAVTSIQGFYRSSVAHGHQLDNTL